MQTYIVHGGSKLSGTVQIGGSKNAALPLLFATLITDGLSVFDGVPAIDDVRAAVSILESYGAVVEYPKSGVLTVDTSHLENGTPPLSEVRKIRASSYLLGAALGRFGNAPVLPFGGCAFCDRPIDMHLSAAKAFGASQTEGELFADALHGAEIVFQKTSVGATVNALFMAVCAKGDSVIRGAATEPHVLALVDYLNAAGADITRRDNTFSVHGSGTLHGAKAKVIPDMIEAGTYLLAGLLTDGKVTVQNVNPADLSPFLDCLRKGGAAFDIHPDAVRSVSSVIRPFSVTTAPFPGFPTDLQPQTAVLMAKNGGGHIGETVFPERFGYLDCLSPLGIRYEKQNAEAEIFPSKIHHGNTRAADLRGGAAVVLAALCADGVTTVDNAQILLRGYENLSTKLSALGADVEIINGE